MSKSKHAKRSNRQNQAVRANEKTTDLDPTDCPRAGLTGELDEPAVLHSEERQCGEMQTTYSQDGLFHPVEQPSDDEPLLEFVVRKPGGPLEKILRPPSPRDGQRQEQEDPQGEREMGELDALRTSASQKLADPSSAAPTTLGELAQHYLEHLDALGKSRGTLASYKLELDLALECLGQGRALASLQAEEVQEFYQSKRVTQTRSARSKSPLSIAKTRRVLRQALALGVERGWVKSEVLGEVNGGRAKAS